MVMKPPLLMCCYVRFLVRPRLLVTAEEFPPHVVVREADGQGFTFSGAMTQILEVLAHSLNFT